MREFIHRKVVEYHKLRYGAEDDSNTPPKEQRQSSKSTQNITLPDFVSKAPTKK